MVFALAEVGIIALFAFCVRAAWHERKTDGGREISLLLSAAFFAALFEDLNVRGLSGRGSYFYNEKFLLDIDRVPLFIILAWAVILWGAMKISDAAPLPPAARVGSDGVLAVMLDLGFDVTAIRHEFWTWRGFAFDEAWFGVPAGNFFGWLWVSLAFSALSRALWHGKPRGAIWWQLLAVPPLGFLLYRALESGTNALLLALHCTSDGAALMAFFLVFALISGAIAVTPKKQSTELVAQRAAPRLTFFLVHGSRLSFHIFAIAGLLALPSGAPGTMQRPVLLLLALLIWALDALWIKRVLKVGTDYGT